MPGSFSLAQLRALEAQHGGIVGETPYDAQMPVNGVSGFYQDNPNPAYRYVFKDGTEIILRGSQDDRAGDGSTQTFEVIPDAKKQAASALGGGGSAVAQQNADASTTRADAATANAATNAQKADQAKNYQAIIPSGEYAGMPLEVAQFLQSAANDKIMRDHAQGQLDQQAAQQQATLVNEALNRAMTGRGQDMSQATAMRGQDINSADQRRGQDMTQQNDIMDNSRSLFETMRPSMVFNPGGYAQLQATQGQIAAASGQPYTPSSPTPAPFDVTSMGKMIAQSVLGRGGSPSPGFSQEPAPGG